MNDKKELSFDTDEAKASYGIGLQFGQQLSEASLDTVDLDMLKAGMSDVIEKREPALALPEIQAALQTMALTAEKTRAEKFHYLLQEGQDFLESNGRRSSVFTTDSGLQYEILGQGGGPVPTRNDKIKVHYTGQLIDGKIFDSSVQRGAPVDIPVGAVVAGWVEALTLMPVGSKWRVFIPQNLAYGEKGAGSAIPPYSTLIFEVELLEILR